MEEGKLALNSPGQRLHPGIREDDGRRCNGQRAPSCRPNGRSPIRDLLTHTAGISYGTDLSVAAQYEREGSGPRRRLRLVHRGQGRADLRHDGAARHAAVRRAAGRGVGLRLQHRHPRLRRRAGVRHAARSSSSSTRITGPLGHEGHALLLPAGAARSGSRPCTGAETTAGSCARPTGRRGRATTSTGRARASPAAPGCCPRRTTTRASSR